MLASVKKLPRWSWDFVVSCFSAEVVFVHGVKALDVVFQGGDAID